MAMLHDFQFSSIISTFCIFVLRPSTVWFVACQITIENYTVRFSTFAQIIKDLFQGVKVTSELRIKNIRLQFDL